MLRSLLSFVIAALFFTACAKQEDVKKAEAKVDEVTQVAIEVFDSLAVNLVGKPVEIKGTVIHVCKHGGTKCFVIGEDEKTKLKVDAGSIEKFEKELEGSDVILRGVVAELRVDKEYLDNKEKEALAKVDEQEKKEEKPGENCAMEGKEEDHHSKEAALKEINALRAELKESGKEFLGYYSLTCNEFEIVSEKVTAEK